MNQPEKTPDRIEGPWCDFSDAAKGIALLIEEKPHGEASGVLIQIVASAVHPDYVMALSEVGALPDRQRAAAQQFISHAVSGAMGMQERVAVLRFIEPHLASWGG